MIVGLVAGVLDRFDPMLRFGRSGDVESFLGTLLRRRVYFLAEPAGVATFGSVGSATLTAPSGRAEPTAAAPPDTGALLPLALEEKGSPCLVLFSSRGMAERYLRRWPRLGERLTVAGTMGVRLLGPISRHEKVALNPATRFEHRMTDEELGILRQVAEMLARDV